MDIKLDRALDDLINEDNNLFGKKRGGSGGRGRGRGGRGRGLRRNSQRDRPRVSAPLIKNEDIAFTDETVWSHDRFAEGGKPSIGKRIKAAQVVSEEGVAILVDNLDFSVSNEDLLGLFKTVGPVKTVEVDYDTSGRSNENATVTFTKKSDAIAAVQRFNGTELVGKRLVISILPNEEKKSEKSEKKFRNRRNSGSTFPKFNSGSTNGNTELFVISAGRGGRRVRQATGGRGFGRGRGFARSKAFF